MKAKQTSMEHRWIPLNKGSRRIHTKLLAGTSEEVGRELGKVGISTFSLKTSALLESLATQRLCFKTQVYQDQGLGPRYRLNVCARPFHMLKPNPNVMVFGSEASRG